MKPFGLSVPERLEDVCAPSHCALVIYDMQVGIVSSRTAIWLTKCQVIQAEFSA